MKIKFKKLSAEAKTPLVATADAACADFYAAEIMYLRQDPVNLGTFMQVLASNLRTGDLVKYNTGIAMEIPSGYVGLAEARSSVIKLPLELANGVGVIDADYRGELSFVYRVVDDYRIQDRIYKVGERCGQMMVIAKNSLEFEEATELNETARGSGGYGSTGK